MNTMKMRSAGGSVLIVLTCVSAAAQTPRDRPAPPSAPAPAGTAVVSGRMTIATATGVVPVRRARVTLESSSLRQPQTTDTDTDGRFRFNALAAASYRIKGEKAGFVARTDDPRRVFEPSPVFELKAGQTLTKDLPMQAGAAVEGRLLKDSGEPAANIVVSAVRIGYDVNGRTPVSVKQAKTDDLGRYRVHTLPPGDYYIDAAPDPLDAMRQVPTPGAKPPVLARTFYPGAPRVDEARTVTVAIGQTLSNLDFSMTSMTVVTVGGLVTESTGAPANGAFVRLQRVGGPIGEVRGGSSVEANNFSFPAVPPGDYWMMANYTPRGATTSEFGVGRVVVEGESLPRVAVATIKWPQVSGRIEGVTAFAGLRVVAHESAFEVPLSPGQASPWNVAVGPDGAFAFASGLPGPRVFRVTGLPAGAAVKSVMLGDVDITDTPTEIKTTDAGVLRVVLTSQTARVGGVVTGTDGKPLAGARVVLFADDERTWGPRSRTVVAVESGADGRYEFNGVLDGAYSIVAVPFLENLAWQDAGVLRRLKTNATSTKIEPGATLTLSLVVKP